MNDGHMKNLMALTKAIVILSFQWSLAQNDSGMLIFQIDGNQYSRTNFDKNNKIQNYQIIDIGTINLGKDILEATLTVRNYDVNNNLQNISETVISCNPDEKEVIMGIFPFTSSISNKTLIAEMPDSSILYPRIWGEEIELDDYDFQLSIKGGVTGFLGTSSTVSLQDRRSNRISNDTLEITGKMTLKAYALGIRVRKVEYNFIEQIERETGIIRQRFTNKKGGYFTIQRESQSK